MIRLFAALLLLLPLTFDGSAESSRVLRVHRADNVGSAVNIWSKGSSAYLFLPAYMKGVPLVFDGNEDDMTQTFTGSEEFTRNDGKRNVQIKVMTSANLPAMHLTTSSGSLDRIHKRKTNSETRTIQIVTASGALDFEGELSQIRARGNSTFSYEKKPYQIKLTKKSSLLGMNPGKTYVLLANQHENSLIRNRITFDLARDFDMRFTPDCRSVDLYINGEYRGNYLLVTKITVASNSVDIEDAEKMLSRANESVDPKTLREYHRQGREENRYRGIAWPNEPTDVTGGFLIEMDREEEYPKEKSAVQTERGQTYIIKHPELMSPAQGEYINSLLVSFENAVFAKDGVDHRSKRAYTEIADLDSFVRKYLLEELCKNYDANSSSLFFYKDSDTIDPLLYAGPAWDYDSAWGNFGKAASNPNGLGAASKAHEDSLWVALIRHRDFHDEVRRLYATRLRPLVQILTGERLPEEWQCLRSIEYYAEELAASAEMNFIRWRVLNHESRSIKTGATYEENIRYLRSWIVKRIASLDEIWDY